MAAIDLVYISFGALHCGFNLSGWLFSSWRTVNNADKKVAFLPDYAHTYPYKNTHICAHTLIFKVWEIYTPTYMMTCMQSTHFTQTTTHTHACTHPRISAQAILPRSSPLTTPAQPPPSPWRHSFWRCALPSRRRLLPSSIWASQCYAAVRVGAGKARDKARLVPPPPSPRLSCCGTSPRRWRSWASRGGPLPPRITAESRSVPISQLPFCAPLIVRLLRTLHSSLLHNENKSCALGWWRICHQQSFIH